MKVFVVAATILALSAAQKEDLAKNYPGKREIGKKPKTIPKMHLTFNFPFTVLCAARKR